MQSKIDPKYNVDENGIWTKEYFSPFETEVKDVYPRVYTETMLTDVGHYNGLHQILKPQFPALFETHYDICHSFGGGLPKIETHLNIDKIVVIDGMVNFYQQHMDKFRQLYGYHKDVEFVELIFNSDVISCYPIESNKKTLFAFIHVLEHQTLQEHLDILGKLPKNIDVLIYGPNITQCKNPGWVHIQPFIKDHNTFIPYLKMKEILESFNYKIYYSVEYSDDLLFYFKTGE